MKYKQGIIYFAGWALGLMASIVGPAMLPAAAQTTSQPNATDNRVAIIANPAVPATALDRQEVLDMYMLETNKWEDGSLVVLIEQKKGAPSKERFYDFLRKKPRELKKIWMRMVLAGEGRTPRTMGSEEDVLQEVASTPGAIGYVAASSVTDDVVVLLYIQPISEAEFRD